MPSGCRSPREQRCPRCTRGRIRTRVLSFATSQTTPLVHPSAHRPASPSATGASRQGKHPSEPDRQGLNRAPQFTGCIPNCNQSPGRTEPLQTSLKMRSCWTGARIRAAGVSSDADSHAGSASRGEGGAARGPERGLDGSLPAPSEGAQPCWSLDLGLPASRTGDGKFLPFQPPGLWFTLGQVERRGAANYRGPSYVCV